VLWRSAVYFGDRFVVLKERTQRQPSCHIPCDRSNRWCSRRQIRLNTSLVSARRSQLHQE
jgi:hypothetical protein